MGRTSWAILHLKVLQYGHMLCFERNYMNFWVRGIFVILYDLFLTFGLDFYFRTHRAERCNAHIIPKFTKN